MSQRRLSIVMSRTLSSAGGGGAASTAATTAASATGALAVGATASVEPASFDARLHFLIGHAHKKSAQLTRARVLFLNSLEEDARERRRVPGQGRDRRAHVGDGASVELLVDRERDHRALGVLD